MKLLRFSEYGSFERYRDTEFREWPQELQDEFNAFDYTGKLAKLKAETDPKKTMQLMSELADYLNVMWQIYAVRDDNSFSRWKSSFDYYVYMDARDEYNNYLWKLIGSSDKDVAWSALMCLAEPLFNVKNCMYVKSRHGQEPFGDVEELLKLLHRLALDPDNPIGWDIWAADCLETIAIKLGTAYGSIAALEQDYYRELAHLSEKAAELAVQTALDLGYQPNMHALKRRFRGELFYQCLMEGPIDLDCEGIGYWGALGLTDEQAVNAAMHGKTASVRRQIISMLSTEQFISFVDQAEDLSGVSFPREGESGSWYSKHDIHANTHFASLYKGTDEKTFLKIAISNANEYTRDVAIDYLVEPESFDALIEKFGLEVIEGKHLRFLSQEQIMRVFREHPSEERRCSAIYYMEDQDFICKQAFKKKSRKLYVKHFARNIHDQRVVMELLFAKGGKQAKLHWEDIVGCLRNEEVIREAIARAGESHPEYRIALIERLPECLWTEFGHEPPEEDDDVSLYDANGYPYMDEFEYMNNL